MKILNHVGKHNGSTTYVWDDIFYCLIFDFLDWFWSLLKIVESWIGSCAAQEFFEKGSLLAFLGMNQRVYGHILYPICTDFSVNHMSTLSLHFLHHIESGKSDGNGYRLFIRLVFHYLSVSSSPYKMKATNFFGNFIIRTLALLAAELMKYILISPISFRILAPSLLRLKIATILVCSMSYAIANQLKFFSFPVLWEFLIWCGFK